MEDSGLQLVKSNWAIITAFVGIVAQWVWFKISITNHTVILSEMKTDVATHKKEDEVKWDNIHSLFEKHLQEEAQKDTRIQIDIAEIKKDLFYIRQKLDSK